MQKKLTARKICDMAVGEVFGIGVVADGDAQKLADILNAFFIAPEISDERLKEVAEEVFAQITGLFNSGPTSEDVRMNGAIGVLRSLLNEAK